jgi:hypothetical protein
MSTLKRGSRGSIGDSGDMNDKDFYRNAQISPMDDVKSQILRSNGNAINSGSRRASNSSILGGSCANANGGPMTTTLNRPTMWKAEPIQIKVNHLTLSDRNVYYSF